jgi:hypothetical protein
MARVLLVLAINAYVHHWDSARYLSVAHGSLTGLLFDLRRAPLYPFLLKLIRYHEPAMIFVQTIIASVGWLFFALTLAGFFRDRRIQWLALLSFYALSCSVPILQWDYVLYAESVSLALFAIVTSFLLRYVTRGKVTDLYWIIALGVPFVLARDSNAFAYGVVALLAIARGRLASAEAERPSLRLALVCAAVPLLSVVSVAVSGRGGRAVENVVLKDIATEPALVDEMVSRHGMPRSVVECAGLYIWDDCEHVEELDAWVSRWGRTSYLRFLLTHPSFAVRIVRRAWVPALGGVGVERYGDFEQVREEHTRQPEVDVVPLTSITGSYYEFSRSLSRLSNAFTFGGIMARLRPHEAFALSLIPFGVLLALAGSRTMRANATSLIPPLFFALVTISQFPVVILSIDAVPRHALLASVSMNLLALYLVLFGLSVTLRQRSGACVA